MTMLTIVRRIRTAIVLALVLATSSAALAADKGPASQKAEASRILQAAGIQGGLIVHVGCGDGKLTAALRASDSYLVHGLDSDRPNVEKAREHLQSLGLYGPVSVDLWTGKRLPYVDNLVNLVVAERPLGLPGDEVLRVLCPGGVAYVRSEGKWTRTVKPIPREIGEWTHFLHDATGNAVARDTRVGPPRHMQWLAEPMWCRNHHTLASISAVVSAGGRVFTIVDEGPAASMALPGKWFLVTRDAFNGTLLWKRPMASWAWHRRGFRSGPVQLPRTLVAAGDRVYAPLGIGAPVAALDAATGQVLRTFKGTGGCEEIILSDGVLMVVTGSPLAEQAAIDPARRGQARFPNDKSVVAVEAETGKELWRWSEAEAGRLVPLTLAAQDPRVFFQVGKGVLCLDRATGKELWRWPAAGAAGAAEGAGARTDAKPAGKRKNKPAKRRKGLGQRSVGWSLATLVVNGGVVLWADGGRLAALSAEDGKALWSCPCQAGFRSPADVFVIGGLVWLGPDFSAGRDLRTGEIKKENATIRDLWTAGHHHRCYREKATERYILTGKRGIEFLDLVGDNHSRNNWIRGLCQYGVMPCNGLIYAPSHACGCFMEAKLYGFWAAAPERQPRPSAPAGPALEKGPAYAQAAIHPSSLPSFFFRDWPTHRHDALRSGSTEVGVPARLKATWQASVGGRLTAPVVAGGTVVVSSVDAHRVVALDAAGGKVRWALTAGGRVDSPPTIHEGLVLFGCADGWVYCVRLADGQLVWRFHAAPEDLSTVARDRLESVWPVHGSVLVQDGVAYAAAGRSSYLDGGIYLYALEPATGKKVHACRVRTPHPKGIEGASATDVPEDAVQKIVQNATDRKTFAAPDRSDAFSMGGATTDVLVSDGTAVYMRHVRFDRNLVRQERQGRHLFSTTRLLDDAEVHRSHWVLGTGDFSRIPVAYSWIANRRGGAYGSRLAVPYGLLLAFDAETVWGVRRGGRSGGYTLFAEANRPFSPDEQPLPDFRKPDNKGGPAWTWSVDLPMRPRALLRAGKRLFLGGMPEGIDPQDPLAAHEGRKGGLLWTMSAADGSKTAEHKLEAPPVWDGMAAAGGRLYVSTVDGKVLCLGGER